MALKVAWHIRPYEKGDEHKILELRKAVFGDLDPVRNRLSTWYWQFRDNPSGEAFCMLAEDGGHVVGQYAAIPTRFCVEGKETVLAFSCDTMTHPGYRGQGIFPSLAQALYAFIASAHGVRVVWGFPNERSLPGFTQRLGWRVLTSFPLRVRPLRPLAMVRPYLPLNRNRLHPRFFHEPGRAFEKACPVPGLVIEPIDHFNRAFDALWKENKNQARVIQVRDSRYLNWRYLGQPEFRYQPFAVKWQERLAGYMVIRLLRVMAHDLGAVVDLFPMPAGNPLMTKGLFAFARAYCREKGATFLTGLFSQGDRPFFRRADCGGSQRA